MGKLASMEMLVPMAQKVCVDVVAFIQGQILFGLL